MSAKAAVSQRAAFLPAQRAVQQRRGSLQVRWTGRGPRAVAGAAGGLVGGGHRPPGLEACRCDTRRPPCSCCRARMHQPTQPLMS